jgi:mannose-6-phosphate isomerase-like protein (cupin superfamily)
MPQCWLLHNERANDMKWSVLNPSAVLMIAMFSAEAFAQPPKSATYITADQIKAVNATPGTDRQVAVVDVGKLNTGIGVIHRAPGAGMATATGDPCGERAAAPANAPNGTWHEHVTETYIILSGSGTLVTGGRLTNGRKSAPESDITKILAGASCSGSIIGDDVIRKTVKTGDVIIIPAGVPHGWADITETLDYLTVRPDPDRVLPAGYVHPAIKK